MKAKQPKRILVPTDFSDTGLLAIEHAAMITRLCKADLYLLHVIESPDAGFIYKPLVVISNEDKIKTEAVKKLNALAAKIAEEHVITVKTLCTKGRPANEIVNAVKSKKIDLVVMGTHGAQGFNEFFVGSNAHKTVTICSCPVITVQTQTKRLGFGKIVLPIDDSLYSRTKVDTTIMLAKIFAAKIHVLGLVHKNGETNLRDFKIKLESVEKAIKEAGLSYKLEVVKGDNLAKSAIRYAKKIKADLISVLTNHESDLDGIFLSGFAKQIVNHSKTPVVSIRPLEGIYDSVSLAGSNSI